MLLRFSVDQAECFRRGIDCPEPIVTVEVNPANLDPSVRNLIADRLDGTEICQRYVLQDGTIHKNYTTLANGEKKPSLVVSSGPTWEDLIETIKLEEAAVLAEATKRKKLIPSYTRSTGSSKNVSYG